MNTFLYQFTLEGHESVLLFLVTAENEVEAGQKFRKRLKAEFPRDSIHEFSVEEISVDDMPDGVITEVILGAEE